MSQKQKYLFITVMILLVTVTCQVGGNPITAPLTEPTQPATNPPLFTLPAPTVSAGNNLHTIFPSFSLADPNTVCVAHYFYGLSCVDANGWHVYKNEYDEVSHPRSTTPNRVFGCPDGRIYLVDDTIYRVEGETLIDIGGYVDMGTLVCGRGDEIWVSDFSDINRFDGSTWIHYSMEEYFANDDGALHDIYFLAVAPNGNVWVTMDNAIATFDGSKWEAVTLPGNYFFMQYGFGRQGLTIDFSGVVWVIAYPETCCTGGQLLRFDGSEWSVFPEPDDDNREVDIIAAGHDGKIWASTGNKIFTLNPETREWELRFDVEQLDSKNEWEARFNEVKLGLGFGEHRIAQMKFDGQGRLWVTTNYGLGVFDGATWTIYHTYTADLYMNDISALTILGNGPQQLPAPKPKPFGSIRGKLVSKTQTPFTDASVRVCIRTGTGTSFCADQSEPVNADGGFLISDVPPGTYTLSFKMSNEWYWLTREKEGYLSFPSSSSPLFEFIVKEGEETQFGEINAP
jgi:streptogramin lyase